MEPNDSLTSDEVSYCLVKEGDVYAVYSEANSGKIKLNLGNSNKKYKIKWYDPRNGGDLQDGSITSINADGIVTLGSPPSASEKDWVILIRLEK